MDKRAFINKKPTNGAFRQQRLRAWQPVLRPTVVIPTLFVIGILFVPIGGVLYWNAGRSFTLQVDYTQCGNYNEPTYLAPSMYQYRFSSSPYDDVHNNAGLAPSTQPPTFYASNASSYADPSEPTFQFNSHWPIQQCTIDFSVPSTLKAPVYLFYRLTAFYQNNNQYIKNFDASQLAGDPVDAGSAGYFCDPLASEGGKVIYPCGLVANSMFNDTVSNLTSIEGTSAGSTYAWQKDGLAWPHDERKYGTTRYSIDQIVPPPNWQPRYPNGAYSAQYPPPDLGTTMDRLKVWMTLAALPDFMKLMGKNDQQDLVAGRYRLKVDLNYDTRTYNGKKWLVITTESSLGTRNFFLGLTYMGAGGLCLVIGTLFFVFHLKNPRTMDHWQPTSRAGSVKTSEKASNEASKEASSSNAVDQSSH
ncbi:ligand-effect modulator 3 family [Gongronella butleri]|nr:ligand-effect modulator 3 family [Gongronella butleri]